ncbi:MAG: hypothetical protein ABEI31_10730 [Halodesulfurarchaeum sp.]
MEVDIRCYNCGEPVSEYEHTQVLPGSDGDDGVDLIHCGNCGSFNSVDAPLQVS